uniref:Uncharacterized protein n=1 Tax=Candidatus Kentrum sp. LFY TaxID=2126342 RepID=A0A450UMB3_9GAMM|nr:MAG: hypothetical protein BECKLFY1418A_GA0070994_10339 [Candidatus Kentron sp. LFY]
MTNHPGKPFDAVGDTTTVSTTNREITRSPRFAHDAEGLAAGSSSLGGNPISRLHRLGCHGIGDIRQ